MREGRALRLAPPALLAAALVIAMNTPTFAQTPNAPLRITRMGEQATVPGAAENFTGAVRVDQRFGADAPARVGGGLVSFEPGARTNWHTHPLGQTLLIVEGQGQVQHWGGPVQNVRPGDVVWIPPGTKHWHGASPRSAMQHWAVAEQLDGRTVTWLEPVTDAQYQPTTP